MLQPEQAAHIIIGRCFTQRKAPRSQSACLRKKLAQRSGQVAVDALRPFGHERADPAPPLDHAKPFQAFERAAHRNAADAVFLADLVFGGQGRAGQKFALADAGAQALFKLVIQRDRPLFERCFPTGHLSHHALHHQPSNKSGQAANRTVSAKNQIPALPG
jgi:uncharacterized protein YbjT (DUF2867 family)